jgi:thioredoxin-related protein
MIGVAMIIVVLSAGQTPAVHNADWFQDFERAVKMSKETGKPIFATFTSESCNWCAKMEEEVFSDPDFKALLQNYIPLKINWNDASQGAGLAKQYRVKTLPTSLVLDPSLAVLNRISGYFRTEDLVNEIVTIQNLIDRERTNPDDWRARQELAEAYLSRDMSAEAEKRLMELLPAPVSDSVKEPAHFSLALAQYYQAKNQEALATIDRYLQIYVDGESVEDVLLLQAQIYVEKNEHDRAKQILKRFLLIFPNSKNASTVRTILRKLEHS